MRRSISPGKSACLGLLMSAWCGTAAVAQRATDRPARGQEKGDPAATGTGAAANVHRGGERAMAARHEDEAMVAHALGMAIEGYSLRCAAKEAGSTGQDDKAGQSDKDPATMLRQHARAAFSASDELFRQAAQARGGRGGRDGARGAATTGTGTGRASGDDRAAAGETTARVSAGSAAGRANDATARTGAAGRAGEAPLGGSPYARFVTASNEYASTLRRLSPEAGEGAKDEASRSRTEPGREDKARIAALNHAVKEVVQGRMIQQGLMMSSMADRSSTAVRTLARHARQMDDEGRRTVQALASQARGGGREEGGREKADAKGDGRGGGEAKAEGEAEMPSASVRTLAVHAQEVLRAVSDLGQAGMNAGGAAGAGREDGAGGDATGNNAGAGGTGTGSRTFDRATGAGNGDAKSRTGTGSGTGNDRGAGTSGGRTPR